MAQEEKKDQSKAEGKKATAAEDKSRNAEARSAENKDGRDSGEAKSSESNGGDLVAMVAYSRLTDPISGQVEEGEEFQTSKENAKSYTRARWAGPPGRSDREIQQAVVAEELSDMRNAKTNASKARQAFRNLSPKSAERGNVASTAAGKANAAAGNGTSETIQSEG